MFRRWLLRRASLLLVLASLGTASGKWVEGRIDTKDNWAFVARFCFLSLEGQFEYLIEYDREAGTPNLLLYYDDDNQWPAVYHSSKSCKEKEAVLNRAGQNQVIKLSHYYPDTEFSGCSLIKQNKEVPASKSTSTTPPPTTKSTTPKPLTTTKNPFLKPKNSTNSTQPPDPSYYDQFLKTTSIPSKSTTVELKHTIVDSNSTVWYELQPSDVNMTTTMVPEDEWESIGTETNESSKEMLKDVELLFSNTSHPKRKRSTSLLYERFRRRRLNSESSQQLYSSPKINTEKYIVHCHNSRRFRSARERWWFIAISNCDSTKGLEIRYRFLMTNAPEGDFWHEHFSADEFYVLPVLLAYVFAYLIVIIAVVMCSIELRCRHLLHSTYKLFVLSTIFQHSGILMQSLAKIKYAVNGYGGDGANVVGQFFCGMSETTFMLVLVLMAKGYTITRARLKVSFTVKLTVFMCCYIVTYVVLFIYQAKEFDPGEVLYLYESPAGYGLIVLRVTAWIMFAYSIFFTVRKYPEKNTFYAPFSICGTLWFFAGPLFILTANSYIDKWVRESVVIAVLLFITFCGHIMFLLLTLPVFANKNFPYHVRTTQIGVMEVSGNPDLDRFGSNPYQPTNGTAQTVIIPLTRRTEELIGSMYTQYITTPHMALENETPTLNGIGKTNSLSPKPRLVQQDSGETNNSDDIKPYVNDNKEIFTVQGQMSKIEPKTDPSNDNSSKNSNLSTVKSNLSNQTVKSVLPVDDIIENGVENKLMDERGELPSVLRSRRNILEPIKRDVPTWSLAKGPAVVDMMKKLKPEDDDGPESPILINGRKVPPVKNGLQSSSGEISTILEGRVQSYKNVVSQPTIELFSAQRKNT